jgi:hypothetical protein
MAGFYKYVQECERLVAELKESLGSAEVDALREDCKALGLRGWDEWFFDNLGVISAFIAATPSQRERRREWQASVLRRRLVLASIQQLIRACNLLGGIHRHGLSPGQSYQQMASKAADAYLDIFLKQPASDWPFDEPNPFERT